MGSGRRWAAIGLLSGALACWAVILGSASAVAEDWTPPPGAPPGCQPPPGECYAPPSAPAAPAPQPKPTSAPIVEPTSDSTADATTEPTSPPPSKPVSEAVPEPVASTNAGTKAPVPTIKAESSKPAADQGNGPADTGSQGNAGNQGGDSPTLRVSEVRL